MKTRIIVDSTADLVPEIKARVSTVPLTVHFGQEEYIDGVTMRRHTRCPSSGTVLSAFLISTAASCPRTGCVTMTIWSSSSFWM